MITPVGKFLRKLRIDLDESMDDMAERLGISKAYLSLLEKGLRDLRQDLAWKIMNEYDLLGDKEGDEFLKALIETPVKSVSIETSEIINIDGAFELARQFAMALPKMNADMVSELKDALYKILRENGIKGVIGDLS